MNLETNKENKILFILNPISGFRNFRRRKIRSKILKNIRNGKINGEVKYSKYAGHSHDIAKEAVKNNTKYIIVAGGDGSINEVARALANTDATLGIIPAGSGNGLAHHLKFPFNVNKVIRILEKFNVKQADMLNVNGIYSASVAGIGFDAIVAERYSKEKNRGFFSYLHAAMVEYFNYKPELVTIKTNDMEIKETIFFMVLANSNQFGYNFRIAPNADLFDGYMDVVIVKNVPIIAAPLSSIQVFTGHAEKSLYISSFKTKKITIIRENDGIVNIDGDPHKTGKIIQAEVMPKSLNIIVP